MARTPNQLYSSSIPNFVNGVSQQPFTLRLNSQGEAQENGLSTISQGLKKRPPTQHLKKISSTPLGDAFIHTINRDADERYIAIITNGDLKVYDVAGVEKTVNFPNGKTYLSSSSVSTGFSAVTVADYTFIVNKSKVVAKGSSTSPTRPYEALINVKAGNYGKTYQIEINGSVAATYTAPDGSVASHTALIATDYIATALYNSLTANGYTSANGWTNSISASTIYISRTSSDFSISIKDGFNGGGMVGIKKDLQKFADLPAYPGKDGFVVAITGTGSGEQSTQPFDSYYVKYTASTGSSGTGVWKECPAPGILNSLDASTMPYVLIREADGSFTFKQATYTNRLVGDDDSNPFPSFVGRTISDVFFYRNRLGFLADEGVIFSEAGEYFNFMRTTVTQLLDSDPIDVNASHTKVSLLKHAVPFNKSLLLFSEQTQFLVDQTDILSPKSIGLKVVTEFPCNIVAKPVGVGKNVYFAVDKGDWTAFREYFADLNNITNDSMDVTGHIPQYIKSGIYKIAAAPNEDILVALSSVDKSKVYVYKFFFANNEKLQSSWSAWSFDSGDSILNVDFIASEMFFVVNRADGVYFEKMPVSLGYQDPAEPYTVHLDRKVQLSSSALTYSAGYTTINTTTLGYVPENGTGKYQAVVQSSVGLIKAGEILEVEVVAGVPRIAGNYSACSLTFGRKYTFSYSLSTITVKQNQPGGGQKSDTEGRLQLRKVAFNYSNAGYFRVEVTPSGRPTYTYTYSGKVLGSTSAVVGAYSISSGRFIAPVVSRNIGTSIVLKNDSPLPCSFLSADWEGMYVKRSAGV